MSLIWLNNCNGADGIASSYHEKVMNNFEGELYGAVLGSAYGGELEAMAKMWGNRGHVYGFDVFEALHPKHLSDDVNAFDATCMDHWYQESVFGTAKMSQEYQQSQLNEMGLNNVTLIKGEVHKDSCKDIHKLHYAFLDMDIPLSMKNGYLAVKNKIVPGGYLLLHDTQNIDGVGEWYRREVIGVDKAMWGEPAEFNSSYLIALERTSTSG